MHFVPDTRGLQNAFFYVKNRREELPMQEEVENRTVALVISGTKLTARSLKAAILKYLAWRKDKKNHAEIHQGKKSLKDLA